MCGRKTNKHKSSPNECANLSTTNPFTLLQSSGPPEPKPPLALATESPKKTKVKPLPPRRRHVQHILRQLAQQESAFLDRSIARAEQERTEIAKLDPNNPARLAIEAHEAKARSSPSLLQKGKNVSNVSYNISSTLKRTANKFLSNQTKHVQFAPKHTVRIFQVHDEPFSDGHL